MDKNYEKIVEWVMWYFKNEELELPIEECLKRAVDTIPYDDLHASIFTHDLSIRKHVIARILKGE